MSLIVNLLDIMEQKWAEKFPATFSTYFGFKFTNIFFFCFPSWFYSLNTFCKVCGEVGVRKSSSKVGFPKVALDKTL